MARNDPPYPFVRHDRNKVWCGWCQREIKPGARLFITPIRLDDIPELAAKPGHHCGLVVAGAPRYGLIPPTKIGHVPAGGGIVFFLCSTRCARELRDAFAAGLDGQPEPVVH